MSKIKKKILAEEYKNQVDRKKEEDLENEIIKKENKIIKDELDKIHLSNLVDNIKTDIIEYVETNSYPLCEYLDDLNLNNYINWVLNFG